MDFVMLNFRDVIDIWDSPKQFAEDIGIPASHARVLKTRNRIPSEYWGRVVAAAQKRGHGEVTLESLVAMAEAKAA
jgi:hypothetical protein